MSWNSLSNEYWFGFTVGLAGATANVASESTASTSLGELALLRQGT